MSTSEIRPEQWERLNSVFDAALERDPRDRPAFVAASCAGDDALRKQIERLLAAHDRADGFIDEPPAPATIPRLLGDDLPPVESQIGAYHLLHEIGHGGMGAVYLAERSDEEYQKRVAIKLIRRGMDTDRVLARFRTERQILASLDHPNIARLLDGGTTDDDLPYFVMEYIEGEPIDVYANARQLTMVQRLELFLPVCSAVAYAHQQLVIHRDIKPVNILVTRDGVPKLLDFGIAKLLDTNSERSRLTLTGAWPLTPEYASPEQVEGLRVATSSDVYSLGVVLYELLTGRLPYRFRSRLPQDIAEAIRSTDPERPSNALPENTPQRLRRKLRGDLDTIVLTALRKEPQRRYSSVEQFGDDIRRLIAGRPVHAHADTPWYRAAKFVRRNGLAVAAAVLVFVALAVGVATTAWQASAARRQARLAVAAQARAERRFNDVRRLANTVLFDYHDAIKNLPGATPIRARLVRDGLTYLDQLAGESANDPSLRRELASAYERVGDVQGGTTVANLGDTPGAIASYRKSLAILEPLHRVDSTNVDTRRALASVTQKLGVLLWETGDVGAALEKNRASLAMLQSLVALAPRDTGLVLELVHCYDYVGMILLDRGDAAGSLANHRRSLELLQSLPRAVSIAERVRRSFSVAYEHEASALAALGDLPGALDRNRRARGLREELAAEFPLNADYLRTVDVSYYNEGEILAQMGRVGEALDSYLQDLHIARRLMSADPRNEQFRGDVAYAEIRVGDMFVRRGEPARALPSYHASMVLRAQDVKVDSANIWKRSSLIEAHAKTAKALALLGREQPALAEIDATRALMKATAVPRDEASILGFFADSYVDLGDAQATMSRADAIPALRREELCGAARELYRDALAIWSDMASRRILSAPDQAKPKAVERRLQLCRSRA